MTQTKTMNEHVKDAELCDFRTNKDYGPLKQGAPDAR